MNDPAYGKRFERVLDYVEQHMSEELSVERLSREANFSKFHFHRQFSAYVGVSASRYVQSLRLRRASRRLVFEPTAKIIDVAIEAGFETPESSLAPSSATTARRLLNLGAPLPGSLGAKTTNFRILRGEETWT